MNQRHYRTLITGKKQRFGKKADYRKIFEISCPQRLLTNIFCINLPASAVSDRRVYIVYIQFSPSEPNQSDWICLARKIGSFFFIKCCEKDWVR